MQTLRHSLQMDETSIGSSTSAFARGDCWEDCLDVLRVSMCNGRRLINTISINAAIGTFNEFQIWSCLNKDGQ